MRVLVLGGTRFVGRAIAAELLGAGHEVVCVHRGRHGAPPSGADSLVCDRRELAARADEVARLRVDGVVDVSARGRRDAETALPALPDVALVAISSIDVYRAYDAVWAGTVTDPVPLGEDAPLRTGPPPDADYVREGYDVAPGEVDNLDVERAYLARGATVCRLPVVYGPHDYVRREEFVLARVRAGRARIPIGAGSWLWSRGYAPELARGVRLALETGTAAGRAVNLCESRCATIRLWAEQILAAAGSDAELVRVPDEALPEELDFTGALPQHWLASPALARELLGWVHADPGPCVAESVAWHLAHPPAGPPPDLTADDGALAAAGARRA
jgi:nucleoside-diphosphate-sugar epimerase